MADKGIRSTGKGNIARTAFAAALSALLLLGQAGAAFADTTAGASAGQPIGDATQAAGVEQTNGQAVSPRITERNIRDGLAFCAEYPVQLSLDGIPVPVKDTEVPPVILTPDGQENGYTLIPARALFETMGATVTWIDAEQSVEVSNKNFTVKLVIGAQTATVNGVEQPLDVPALIIDHDNDYYGSTMIPVRFVAEALKCGVTWINETRTVAVTSPVQPPSGTNTEDPNGGSAAVTGSAVNSDPNRGDDGSRPEPGNNAGSSGTIALAGGTRTDAPTVIGGHTFPAYDMTALPAPTVAAQSRLIALDMGHGGYDAGSSGHKDMDDQFDEKDVNLAIGLKVRDYLKEAGMTLYMIRESDVYIEKKERAYMANEADADLFVSFHNNSSDYAAPNGTETHYNTKTDEQGRSETELYGISSKAVAEILQKEMIRALGTNDRGTKNSPELAVLNKTEMPAVIVEGAFLSNEENLAMMRTDEFVNRYAYACAKGIITALNQAFPD